MRGNNLRDRWLLGCLLVGLVSVLLFGGVVEGVDMQWQHPVILQDSASRDGSYAEVDAFLSGDQFLYFWYSPYIPPSEQRLAAWPGRIPDSGDHTLVTDVINEDDTDSIPDFGPYTVTLQTANAFRRCQELTIGGSWNQELNIDGGDLTIGFVGNNRVCQNTISFGPGFREGRRGDNIIYLSTRDLNENSLGAGSEGIAEYWVVAVSFEGNVFSDSTQIDHEDGTYTIAYRAPGVCGPAVLFVGCGTLRVGIPGSPFQINFFDCDPPPVTNATISRNGVQLEILFEYGTDLGGFAGGGFDCRDLLEYQTGLFGTPGEVYCYWRRPDLLILVFGKRATVLPGDTLTLLADFIRGAPPLQTPTLNETLITVLAYNDPDIPRLHICGPEIVPSCIDSVRMEAASSRGTGGREFVYDVNSVGLLDDDSDGFDTDSDYFDPDRDNNSDGIPDCGDMDSEGNCDDPDWYWKMNPNYAKRYTTLTPIQWSLLAPKDGDTHVETILANVTDLNYYDLEFDVNELTTGVEYVFLAQATNYLGQYSSALHSFTIVQNETAPVVNIYAPTTVQMYRSSPLLLLCEAMEMCDAQILVPNRTRLNYFWTVTTEAYDGDSIGVIDVNDNGVPEYSVKEVFGEEIGGESPILEIPGYAMIFEYDYTYTCYVSIGEGAAETGEGSDSVNIELISAPLQACSVDGPQRSIYAEYEFLMDGSCSIDPNGVNEEDPIEYQWCCTKQTFPFQGQACDNTAFPLGGFCSDFSAVIPARSFNSQTRQFQSGEYLFTLNIRQGDRTATYDVLIALVTEEIPTIHTDEIETYFVDASEPLLLKGYLESTFQDALNNVGVQYWTVDPPYFQLNNDATLGINGINSSYLYISPNVIPQGIRFDFTYHFRQDGLESESLAGITVTAKENPGGGFCFVDTMNPDDSPTTNKNSRCIEYEADLDVQYVDLYFMDPLIDQQPYPRLLAAPVMCSRPLLIPPGTNTLFAKVINGVSSRLVAHSFEEAQRPEFDFDDMRGVIDTLQLQSGLMGRYNNFLQVHSYLLNMINYKISYYEPDLVDGFPNYVCLPLDGLEQAQLTILREKIFLSFSSLYLVQMRDTYYYENLAYITDSCVSPCTLQRTQYLDVQVMVFLTSFNQLNDIQLFRQTDLAGTLFAKGMQDILINIKEANSSTFSTSSCTYTGVRVWDFLLNLSSSYMIDGVPGVEAHCITWDRTWFCDFKDLINDGEVPNRQEYSNRAVKYELSDEVISDLEAEDGANVYDVLLVTSDFQPDECRHPQSLVSAFSDFSLKVNLGVTPFTIQRLGEPIRGTIPLILEEGELAATPYPAYWDPANGRYKTDGLELDGIDYSYPGYFYSGSYRFTTTHATSFASIQDVPNPDEFLTDDPKVELWWFLVFVFAFLLLIFIAVFVPLMWREYREKKQAAYEFPAPPPTAGGVQMDQLGGGDDFGGEEEDWDDGGEFFDEDEEFYDDEDYDEEEE